MGRSAQGLAAADPVDHPDAMFLGEDLLAWLVLAIGAAMAVGTTLALVRPRPDTDGEDLARPPLGRSVVMIVVGTVAALWGLASLVS
jgi:hypothetical protein